VRLADTILRGGHLSERTLVDVCMTGERPVHLDRCEICAERAVELGRWLDDTRAAALEEADAAFPAERLALQQTQILRKLEQADRPKRVISFPGYAPDERPMDRRGIRPAWVGVAAAAGLVLGLIGGQVSARFTADRAAGPATPAQVQQPIAPAPPATPANVENLFNPLDLDVSDRPQIASAEYLDAYTPHAIPASEHVLHIVAVSGR
jgi:hypothetical protein